MKALFMELIYMGTGLLMAFGIPICLYRILLEQMYRMRFKKAFGLKEIPVHIKIRTTKPGHAPGNTYEVDSIGCILYVNGWLLTSDSKGEIYHIFCMLEEKDITFSKPMREEDMTDDADSYFGLGVIKSRVYMLIVILLLCCVGMCLPGTIMYHMTNFREIIKR